jgi:hypothetical protein
LYQLKKWFAVPVGVVEGVEAIGPARPVFQGFEPGFGIGVGRC